MTLVKQPGPEATDQSCTVDTATDPTAAAAPGACSPGSSPLAAGSEGTAAAGAAMGTETDGSGRRSSRRRRQPNSRIVDELEPSEREKAWGRGRGRRKLTSDKLPEKPAIERPSGAPPRRSAASPRLPCCIWPGQLGSACIGCSVHCAAGGTGLTAMACVQVGRR